MGSRQGNTLLPFQLPLSVVDLQYLQHCHSTLKVCSAHCLSIHNDVLLVRPASVSASCSAVASASNILSVSCTTSSPMNSIQCSVDGEAPQSCKQCWMIEKASTFMSLLVSRHTPIHKRCFYTISRIPSNICIICCC